jgi:hypothetical protein
LNGSRGRASSLESEEGGKALIWALEYETWILILVSRIGKEVGGVRFFDLCEHRKRGSGSWGLRTLSEDMYSAYTGF